MSVKDGGKCAQPERSDGRQREGCMAFPSGLFYVGLSREGAAHSGGGHSQLEESFQETPLWTHSEGSPLVNFEFSQIDN